MDKTIFFHYTGSTAAWQLSATIFCKEPLPLNATPPATSPDAIRQQVLGLAPLINALRRDLHRHPETSWLEYRTAAVTARYLLDLGYDVTLGGDAVCAEARLDPPCPHRCAEERARAVAEGADPHLVTRMGDGLTGLWADLHCTGPAHSADGNAADTPRSGPLLALRFDMDANDIVECPESQHFPTREGFASCHAGAMHACGHDGHTAMGMGVAAILKHLQSHLHGTVRLIFQPAEELGQGALAMLRAGAMQGVDQLIGLHLGVQAAPGDIICGTTHFLATTTFEATFEGKAAHAGIAPEEGRNALMAATSAVQSFHAIPRHGHGPTRINVGQLTVDGAPNIIPARAWLAGETRGVTSAINTCMMDEVERMTAASARMWGCRSRLRRVAECPSGASDPTMAERVASVAQCMGGFRHIIPTQEFWASEDFTWLLNEVQEQGGHGTYIQLGVKRPGGHHTERFDFDEDILPRGMELLVRLVVDCLAK